MDPSCLQHPGEPVGGHKGSGRPYSAEPVELRDGLQTLLRNRELPAHPHCLSHPKPSNRMGGFGCSDDPRMVVPFPGSVDLARIPSLFWLTRVRNSRMGGRGFAPRISFRAFRELHIGSESVACDGSNLSRTCGVSPPPQRRVPSKPNLTAGDL